MHPATRGNRSTRRCQPKFESLESRDVPSSNPLGPALPGKHYPAPDVQQFVPLPSTLLAHRSPLRLRSKRESFIVKGTGRYTIGPGRFDTQTISIHGFGKPATSNLSRRIHFQYLIFEPKDGAQAVTGAMNLVGGNFLHRTRPTSSSTWWGRPAPK